MALKGVFLVHVQRMVTTVMGCKTKMKVISLVHKRDVLSCLSAMDQ